MGTLVDSPSLEIFKQKLDGHLPGILALKSFPWLWFKCSGVDPQYITFREHLGSALIQISVGSRLDLRRYERFCFVPALIAVLIIDHIKAELHMFSLCTALGSGLIQSVFHTDMVKYFKI